MNYTKSKQVVLFALTLFILFSCSNRDKQNVPNSAYDRVYFGYTKFNENGNAIDSLRVCESSYENTLDFYKELDSLNQTIPNILHISIFKIQNEKFAVVIDSTTKIYKFNGVGFKMIYNIKYQIGLGEITQKLVDVNLDLENDMVIEISSGGTYGSDFIVLFYNPDLKMLVYDKGADLRNCDFDLKNGKVKSNYNWFSIFFDIKKYSFEKKEMHKYLNYTSGSQNHNNMIERTIFNQSGGIIKVDTLR